jgi:uncharacterized protein
VTPAQALSDLRWLLLSPPLLDAGHPRFAGQVFEFSAPQRWQIEHWLVQLVEQPQALMDWLASKPERHLARLGRYAEQLLEFFLRYGPTHQLVAANIPLRADPKVARGDHTTVGEIDYLLQDTDGQRWHWELAVKYFLCCDVDQPETVHLIGPDAVENFDHKLEKLFHRQLRHALPEPFACHQWRAAAFTRGWMFYPIARAGELVAGLNPIHLRGYWLTLAQLQAALLLPQRPEPLDGERFQILDRQRWLASAQVSGADLRASSVLTAHEVAQAIELRWQGPYVSGVLVAQMQANGDHLIESNRFFVVPNVWPEPAIAPSQVSTNTDLPQAQT